MLITNSLYLFFFKITRQNTLMGQVWPVGHQFVTSALIFGIDPPRIHIPFKLDWPFAEYCTEHGASKAGRWVALDNCNLESDSKSSWGRYMVFFFLLAQWELTWVGSPRGLGIWSQLCCQLAILPCVSCFTLCTFFHLFPLSLSVFLSQRHRTKLSLLDLTNGVRDMNKEKPLLWTLADMRPLIVHLLC